MWLYAVDFPIAEIVDCEIEGVPFMFFGYEMKATTCKYQANRCCILTGKTTAGDALMS